MKRTMMLDVSVVRFIFVNELRYEHFFLHFLMKKKELITVNLHFFFQYLQVTFLIA